MKKILLLLPMLLVLLFATGASADTVTFNLDVRNYKISDYLVPYAEVKVDLTSDTTATITFTSLTNTYLGDPVIYLMGDGGSVAVNVNATSWTLGPISGSNSGTGFTPGPFSGNAGNEDGFGSFNQTINDFDGFTHSANTISFSLTNISATWESASNVLTANGDGYLAAAHIFVTSSPANANNRALATGYAGGKEGGGGGGGVVPEAGTMLLLGSGLIGCSIVARKKYKK